MLLLNSLLVNHYLVMKCCLHSLTYLLICYQALQRLSSTTAEHHEQLHSLTCCPSHSQPADSFLHPFLHSAPSITLACTAAHCHSGTDIVSAAATPFAAPSSSAMVCTIATAAVNEANFHLSEFLICMFKAAQLARTSNFGVYQ